MGHRAEQARGPERADPRSAYEAIAEQYAADIEDYAFNALYERPATIALLPPVAGRRVLDAGCGSGPLSTWLVGNGPRWSAST